MSNRSRELKRRNRAGLRPLAKSIASSCWGISVPRIETMARIIKSNIVSLTELKKFHIAFDFFFASGLAIIINLSPPSGAKNAPPNDVARFHNTDFDKLQIEIRAQKV